MKSGSAALKKESGEKDSWRAFRPGDWCTSINVRDFIVRNVTPYAGDEKFLAGASPRTKAVWAKLQPYFAEERKKGVLAVDAQHPSTLLAHKPGYIDRDNEVIVGLQTDQPFKRAIFPFGGLRMVEAGLKAAGFEADPAVHETFTKYRKSHNDGVFDAYTPEIMNCRRSGIITGLPDAYGRGRIIGDYRRVALYGVDRLLEVKQEERAQIDDMWPTDEIIRMREELAEQMRALKDLAAMAKNYGCDISKPATNAQEAFQWTYFAYLGAIKEANGAAMSIGRISSFLDVYIERDLKQGTLDEAGAQELWDQLVQKLRIVRFLRTPDYDALFSGDPYWATECVGGMDLDGRESHAWPRQPWLAGVLPVRCQAPLQGRAGRDQLHRIHRATEGASSRGAASGGGHQGVRPVFRPRRLPHEPERHRPRNARRRHQEPGQVPAAHNPRVRLCRKLRSTDAGATEGCDQPDVPWPDLTNGGVTTAPP